MAAIFNTPNARNRADATMLKTIAVPTGGATVATDAIKLVGSRKPEQMEIVVDLPFCAVSLGETIVATITDSADNNSYAAAAQFPVMTLTSVSQVIAGVSLAGTPATQRRFRPAVGLRDYIELELKKSAGGGTSTSEVATLAVLF